MKNQSKTLATYYYPTITVTVVQCSEGEGEMEDIFFDLYEGSDCLNLGDPIWMDDDTDGEVPSYEYVKEYLTIR